MKPQLKLIPDQPVTRKPRKLHNQTMAQITGRKDYTAPVLKTPVFPDATSKEVKFGTLGEILRRLAK